MRKWKWRPDFTDVCSIVDFLGDARHVTVAGYDEDWKSVGADSIKFVPTLISEVAYLLVERVLLNVNFVVIAHYTMRLMFYYVLGMGFPPLTMRWTCDNATLVVKKILKVINYIIQLCWYYCDLNAACRHLSALFYLYFEYNDEMTPLAYNASWKLLIRLSVKRFENQI